jgi:hypothetical protein
MRNENAAYVLVALACAVLAGCEGTAKMDFPSTSILSVDAYWGVTLPAYTVVYRESKLFSSVTGILRRGDVVEILERTPEATAASKPFGGWIKVRLPAMPEGDDQGWIFADALVPFANREMALNASRVLQ